MPPTWKSGFWFLSRFFGSGEASKMILRSGASFWQSFSPNGATWTPFRANFMVLGHFIFEHVSQCQPEAVKKWWIAHLTMIGCCDIGWWIAHLIMIWCCDVIWSRRGLAPSLMQRNCEGFDKLCQHSSLPPARAATPVVGKAPHMESPVIWYDNAMVPVSWSGPRIWWYMIWVLLRQWYEFCLDSDNGFCL